MRDADIEATIEEIFGNESRSLAIVLDAKDLPSGFRHGTFKSVRLDRSWAPMRR
jgi:hypothetical protein